MSAVTLKKSAGRIAVALEATRIGDDLLVVITGGDGHIGAVGAGTNCGGWRSPPSLPCPAHRDDRIVKDAAEEFLKDSAVIASLLQACTTTTSRHRRLKTYGSSASRWWMSWRERYGQKDSHRHDRRQRRAVRHPAAGSPQRQRGDAPDHFGEGPRAHRVRIETYP